MASLCELMSKLDEADIKNIKAGEYFEYDSLYSIVPVCPLATLGIKLGMEMPKQIEATALRNFFKENFGIGSGKFDTFVCVFDESIKKSKMSKKKAIEKACKAADSMVV